VVSRVLRGGRLGAGRVVPGWRLRGGGAVWPPDTARCPP